VVHRGIVIADTTAPLRVLETSHPPTYYMPFADVDMTLIEPVEGSTFCEWKGLASYGDIVVGGERLERAAWWYPEPTPGFANIVNYLALYPGQVDSATVEGEVVDAQEGDFYGGWITSWITGPFKGAPGTRGW
jgi:uncharacterized protein (DUF427 family)